MRAQLLSLATAVPENVLRTHEVMREAETIFTERHGNFARMKPVFVNAGIECRYSVRPFAWFRQDQGWPERSAAYAEGAKQLFRRAAAAALDSASLAASCIDTIVMVSSTGIATPSIEAMVLHEMGFRDDVRRVPVFGLGCAGGVAGLSLAARLAEAAPGSLILAVTVELCTLAFRPDEETKSNIIATALFGDGAAACVVRAGTGRGLCEIEHCGEYTWPGTTDVMGWRIDPQGFGAIFSRSIPDLVSTQLKPAATAFLSRHGLGLDDVECFTFHPGGAKVIAALEEAFDLKPGSLKDERAVLAAFGNMSAPTVLFVLERALAASNGTRRLIAALGPGFTAGFITMLQ